MARFYNMPPPGAKETQKETEPAAITADGRTTDQKMRAHAVAVVSDILILDDKFIHMTTEEKVYAIVHFAELLYKYVKQGVNEK